MKRARAFWDLVRRSFDPRFAVDRGTVDVEHSVPSTEVDLVEALAQLEAIRAECRALVTRRASLSAGAAIVPLPGLDIGTDVAILLKLLPTINEKFGLSPDQIDELDIETKRVVMMFVSAVGSNLIGRLITRDLVLKVLLRMGVRVTTKGIVRYVPLIGQAVSASISFGAMKLLGNRHIDDCYEVASRSLLSADAARRPASGEWEIVA